MKVSTFCRRVTLCATLQLSLKETLSTQRSLESQLSSRQNTDSGREFKIKELEGRMRALEKENEMLRQKVTLHWSLAAQSRTQPSVLDA